MTVELARARFPRVRQRERAAPFARNAECVETGCAQVIGERSDRAVPDHVARTGHRKCCNRNAAGKRLKLHDTECVGEAWKDEHIGRRDDASQFGSAAKAEEHRVGEAPAQFGFLWPLADDNLRARQLKREKRLEVLLNGDATRGQENRPRQTELNAVIRRKHIRIDAAGPHAKVPETALPKFRGQRRRRYHRHGCRRMETP